MRDHRRTGQRPTTVEDYQKRINLIVDYIDNHLGEVIDLQMLAERSGFSPCHFHRILKAFLGEPIGALIVRKRVETAARLLRYSELPVAEIAWKIGYDAPSSLSKAFRQFYGISPKQFRNNKDHVIMKPIQINTKLNIRTRFENIEPRKVVYVRLTGHYPQMDFVGAWGRLGKFLHENVPEINCPEHLCVYCDDPKVTEADKLRADVCFTVDRDIEPKGEVGVKELHGGKYAVFLYQGPYDNLGSVYDTIYGNLLPESGCKLDDHPVFEKYMNDPRTTTPENLLTEIWVPVS